jgi:uncharacterized protein YegP (UPF0339 family)
MGDIRHLHAGNYFPYLYDIGNIAAKQNEMKFLLFKSKKTGQYYWHIQSTNGKLICQSEGYKSKKNALKTVNRIRLKAATAVIIEK